MSGLKQFVGRRVLVTTTDGGAVSGILWRARRGGIEIRKATEMKRGDEIAGAVWFPASAVIQVQIVGGDL